MGGRASTSARGRSAVLPEGSEVGGRVSLTSFSVTGALQGTIDSVANNTNLALRRLRADGDAAAVAVASVKQLPGGGYVLEDSNGNQKRLSDDTVNWFKRRNGDALSGSRAFVPWIVQQAYFEKGLDDVVIHRGSGAVVFSDASGFTALTERLAQKSNGAELLSQCLTAFFTPLINLITDYRGDVIKFSGDALMIYYPATDDLDGPQKKYKVPPHGSFGLPDLGPMATAVLRACACCIEIQKRLHNFETGVDGVRLCLHIGVGCGDVAILQVGGVEPPETHVPRSEYIVAGPPLEQVAIAEPLAKNGETCVSPQAWEHVQNCVIEDRRRTLELNPDYHLLLKLDESRYTFPTIKFSAKERDRRHEKQFQLSELDFIRRYIPSAVFKQIEGGTLTYVNEMRRVSTIFVNVSGLDVSTDAGALIAQDLTSSIQRACYVNEGTLNKFVLDDKGLLFLLVYGLPPLVHTDDPTRAVLTCFEIVKIFKRLSLVGRCGVTTGRVYCGVCGSAERMEYTVLGDDVNLSARLMANAPAGGILVDSPTATECTDELGFEALPCILVKGKSSEIPIFRPERKFPTWHVGVGPGGNLVFPWYVRPGTSAKRGSGCTEASVTELKQNVRHLCSLGGWSGIEKALPRRGQIYGGGLPLSEFNKLVPPGWRPGIPGYPIKLFFERLKLWYRVTDNAEAQLGILVAGRLQGAPQKIALRLRLPRPVAAGGGHDIGDEALIRLSQEQVIDPATNTIVQEYIPSGLQFLCQALRAIYGLQDQDRTTVALDSFYEFKRGHLGLAEFAQEFDHRYESAEDEAGLQMNDTGKTYFFLRGSGLGDKIIEDIKLQMRGDMSRYQEIRTLVCASWLARANDKDKETLNMYQDQTDFNYKVNLDETNGNYYGSWHDPTTGEIIEYDYGANTSDDMYYGDYDYVYDGEYSDYDGASYDDDWYGDDGWQDEVYHGDFPLEEWTWPASAPDSTSVSTAETTLLDVDSSYWKGQTKGKGKGFGAKGKGPSGGSASGIGCTTCGSRWHSSLDCPLNDPSKGDQGKGKGGKDHHYENFWKGKGKGKKGGKSKGFGKGWSKGFGKYRPSFGSGKGYGKYSGGYGKSYGKSYGKGKFKGGYGGFRYSSPYNFTAFQDYEVQDAPEHAPTIAFKADGSGTQYYDFEDEKPSSSTRPPPQSTTEPMIDTAGNPGYNDGYGELDTATAPVPDVRVNALSFLVGTCSSAFPTDHEDWSSLYHSVRGVKRHGLLIDPGAASGLIGSDTLKEFRDEILLPLGVDIICRPTTQNVSGISGKPEPALSRVTMPIFPGIKSSTFTADVIGKQGSKCPALLPNPSMRAANMGLLTNFFENGDGMLIVHDNGKRLLYRCLLTESGHYILPTDNVKNNNNVDKEATRKASAFYAAVLHDATQQWSDISSVYLAVDKAAVAETMIDHVPPSTRSTGWKQSLAGGQPIGH
ncbi:unnamed protein product [Polarella glacialis]|uniref:Guanylate cyclase domain-containing protein n=1 Tax=Polarella glacialis TaxID=89957 RepID=A0A813EW85_POLGL|nr:unnamed protein product [Polarella glacialis]